MSTDLSTCGPQARPILFGKPVPWHPLAVGPVRLACVRAVKWSQYGKFLMQAPDWTWVQAYACRDISGSTSHSEHSHSLALDIRPWENPMREDGIMRSDFDRFGLEDGIDFLAAFLTPPPGLPYLFRWGGIWTTQLSTAAAALADNGRWVRSGRVDAMHLELELSLSQIRSVNWDALIAQVGDAPGEEEDLGALSDLTPTQQKALADFVKTGRLKDTREFWDGVKIHADGGKLPKKGLHKRRFGFRTRRTVYEHLGIDKGE